MCRDSAIVCGHMRVSMNGTFQGCVAHHGVKQLELLRTVSAAPLELSHQITEIGSFCRSSLAAVISSRELTSFSDIFFFSSRRRHTRCSRDWSSDVCSSD